MNTYDDSSQSLRECALAILVLDEPGLPRDILDTLHSTMRKLDSQYRLATQEEWHAGGQFDRQAVRDGERLAWGR